jgi:hypothetical protein
MSEARRVTHEESPEVHVRRVLIVVAIIVVSLLAIAFGLALVFPDRIGISGASSRPFPPPGVTPDEVSDRLARDARQRADLAGANERMPIDKAMAAIVAKGPHAFDPVGEAQQ